MKCITTIMINNMSHLLKGVTVVHQQEYRKEPAVTENRSSGMLYLQSGGLHSRMGLWDGKELQKGTGEEQDYGK